jgi:preprotein translocase subunit SecF
VKAALAAAPELQGVRIEDVTQDRETGGGMVIRLENAANDALLALEQKFGKGFASSVDSIGAAVSKDLQRNAFLAIAGACVLIAIYLWLRFDWDFAPGVILALVHDAIVVVGVWSIAGKTLGLEGFEFNLTIVAAVLAIIGYSVNDTVVIYDRIRENKDKFQGKDILWVVNKSVNETLSRTVLTSGATMLSVLSIALLGSESIRWFGWAMVVGLISGTWSTIAVAVPVTMLVYHLREKSLREATERQPHVGAKG